MRDAIVGLVERPEIRRQISPGFYFQRCLELWAPDLRGIEKEKARAVHPLEGRDTPPVAGDPDLFRAILVRQGQVFTSLRGRFDGLEWKLRGLTPFVTGIGSPHPLESGFAFLKPYGVPYLAGSGVKGAVRAACTAEWIEQRGAEEARALFLHYFGSEDKEPRRGRDEDHQRGALIFLDLFPEPPAEGDKPTYRLDLVNPHYGPYYQGESVPADWLAPVPSYFLTLRGDLDWHLRVLYAPASHARDRWVEDIVPGIERALTESGLGAKKTWGYGLLTIVSRTDVPPGEPAAGERGGPVAQTMPSAPALPTPAPAPARSAAARALDDLLTGLRPHTVKPHLSSIEQHLRTATPDEQAGFLERLGRRLGELGLKKKDASEILKRVRAQITPPQD